MPTWRALLPETREPNDVPWKQAEEWVLKPALGRVGEGVAIQGVTEPKALKEIARDASKHPRDWAAQQRFETVPLAAEQARIYPCIGVFVIGGAAAGAYGRLAPRPLINYAAWDAAVLIPETDGSPTARNEVTDGKGTDF
jgi:glutathionylspermidine synthase